MLRAFPRKWTIAFDAPGSSLVGQAAIAAVVELPPQELKQGIEAASVAERLIRARERHRRSRAI
jgi:hypothetical protein